MAPGYFLSLKLYINYLQSREVLSMANSFDIIKIAGPESLKRLYDNIISIFNSFKSDTITSIDEFKSSALSDINAAIKVANDAATNAGTKVDEFIANAISQFAPATHSHDDYLSLYGGTVNGNVALGDNNFLQTPYLTGETKEGNWQYKKSHGIQIGMPYRDYLNFYECGGIFNFYKTDKAFEEESGDGVLCGRVTENGWEGNVIGNASTATKLATARTINITGAVVGSATFDGSGDITITTASNSSANYGTTAPSSLANGEVFYVYE